MVAAAVAAMSVAAVATPAQGRPAARRAHARIKVKPAKLMVNQSMTLMGAGFPRSSDVTLKECASMAWIVPEEPCAEGATVTVKTNALGRFKTSLKAAVCDGEMTGPTERKCYVGAPDPSGIDTIELLGAATILVSYP